MKLLFILTATVALFAVYINAQSPPTVYTCVVPTGLNFCGSVVTYPVVNSTTWASSDTAAQGYYNATLASLPNTSSGCQAALQTFYCQSSFPRCNTYTIYSGVAASRCNAVNTQCNITGFPSGYSGTPCINNTYVSVDSSATCAGISGTSLGQSCVNNAFNPSQSPASFQVVACPVNTICNTTQTNPTCVKPNNLGDACNGTCLNGPFMGTTSLSCIGGTCQYYGKRFGYQCISNAECLSNNCTGGTCWESPQGGYCSNSNQCRRNLYCDLYNQTCYPVAQGGEYCGIVYSNWSPVPCATGYTCVSGNHTLATCQPNAQVGATCSVYTGAASYNNPLCIPSTFTAGTYQCINNVCTNVLPQQAGQVCNSTLTCDPSLTCQYSGGSSQGVCSTPSSVQCSSFGPQCNAYQYCNCGSSGGMGTCTISSLSPAGVCSTQFTNLASCLFSNCGSATAPFIFYDQYSCGSQSCSAQVNALVCCEQYAQANWVPPNGTPSNVCATPSPSPSPTSSPSSTPTPTPTSDAATVAINFIALILMVVALL